ncbi:MAG: DUF4123 domain-containing protein [Gammaproteobacteria bacterium]
MADLFERFHSLKQHNETLRFYALVDGFQYTEYTRQRIQYRRGVNRPLLLRTEDEPLMHAGPWLIDVLESTDELSVIQALEFAVPSVSWMITSVDLEGLAQLLQLKLDAELPDGRKALLRFYDPRVLGNLARTLNADQRDEFFYLIDEWHFMYQGKRVMIGRSHA